MEHWRNVMSERDLSGTWFTGERERNTGEM